jgi:hypothetical protein
VTSARDPRISQLALRLLFEDWLLTGGGLSNSAAQRQAQIVERF